MNKVLRLLRIKEYHETLDRFDMTRKYMKMSMFHIQNISPTPMAQQPLVGQGLLTIEALRLHSDTSHLVRRPWTRDRTVTETST
jgi:hypothetical protein